MLVKIIFFVVLLLHVLCISSTTVQRNENCENAADKCTAKDPRQIYPKCMLFSDDYSLWCDQSNYTSVPDPDGILPYISCKNATALYINDSCLQNLKPSDLKKYTDIVEFKCGLNYIKKLQKGIFSSNTKLVKIDFCRNEISHIEEGTFKGLRRLEVLNLANNDMDGVDTRMFAGLISLRQISFHKNKIQILHKHAFKRLSFLEVLTLTANKISHIHEDAFDGLERLTHLHLDENKLSGIHPGAFSKLTSLRVLTISYNKLLSWPDFTESSLSNLHTLNLAHNMLEEFKTSNIANLSQLQNLSLENNSLSVLPEDLLLHNTNLRYLNMANNILEEIGNETFAKSCHLETLILRNNRLKTPRAEWFLHVIKNDVTGGNDVSVNRWKCDCDTMHYAWFLATLDPAWQKALNIKCDSPKKYESQFVDTVKEFESDCVASQLPLPGTRCNASDAYTRVTEVHTYTPTTEENVVTTGVPALGTGDTTTAGGSDKADGHHITRITAPQHENTIDNTVLLAGIVAAVLMIAFLCVLFVLKRRIRKRYLEDKGLSESDIDEKLPVVTDNRTDLESGIYNTLDRDQSWEAQRAPIPKRNENDALLPSRDLPGGSPDDSAESAYVAMRPQLPSETVPKRVVSGGQIDAVRYPVSDARRRQPDGESIGGVY